MTDEKKSGRPDWTNSDLYRFLCELFPEHRTILRRFDVERLSTELEMSHEAVYQWFRKGRLMPRNVAALQRIAREQGLRVPEVEEFSRYVFA